ncbi:MAG: metal-dependent hydrolase [Minisyncoccia bacterium]
MTFPTHLLAGLVLGKVTGNYPLSIGISVGVDIDHLYSYAKNGVLVSPKKFFKTVFDRNDPYGDQRNILHNVLIFLFITAVTFILNIQIGLIVFLAYLGHLILDALDKSDYFPFFPNKKVNIKGFIDYFSKKEFFIMIFLGAVFLLI